ncbi:mucin-4 isoform X1 [Equus quagga]|uniref:mucin-4 isoform X1 n=1 Tax=Equus quagga TaxID=89248 RepID=UPI001EE367D0|nr:mucin-4 isoform X1 [Equus quagga]
MQATTGSRTHTSTVGSRSTPSSCPSKDSPTENESQETSNSGEANTPSPSCVSHTTATPSEILLTPTTTEETLPSSGVSTTPPMTSMVLTTPISADNPVGTTKAPPVTVTRSFSPGTESKTASLEAQSTLSYSSTLTQKTSASSQKHQTQSMQTTTESETSTITEVSTSTASSSPSRHTPTEGDSVETSPVFETSSTRSINIISLTTSELLTEPTSTEKASSPSSVSKSPPVTSRALTTPISGDTTVGTTRDIQLTATRGFTPGTATDSRTTGLESQSTVTSSSTLTQETSASAQKHQTQSIQTTRESESSRITLATISTLSTSPSGFTPSGRISQETSPSSVSHTPLTTSQMLTSATSADTTLGSIGEPSLSVTGSFSPFTSKFSTTLGSEIQSAPLSTSSSIPKTSTVFHTYQSEGTETLEWPHASSSISTDVSYQTITPGKATTFASLSSSDSHTTRSQKRPSSAPTIDSSVLVTESTSTSAASTISWVTSKVSTTGKEGEPSTHPYQSTSPQETTVVVSHTQWTQDIGTTGETHVSTTISNVTQTINTVTSTSPSSMLSGHTSQLTIIASPTRRSTPLSISTSPQESSAVSQIGHTQGRQTTQEAQTMSLVSSITDIIKTTTSATSSFKPSGHSPSESIPQDTSTAGEVTVFTQTPSRDSSTTQATTTTTELWTVPSRPDTTLETSGGTSFSITSVIPQATSVVSTSRGPRGQSISPATSSSPDTTSAIFQTHQTQATATTGESHTITPASLVMDTTLVADTTLVGTAIASSTANSQTTPGSASPEMSTSDKIKSFSPTPSRESQTTQSTTELFSISTSHDTTLRTMGMVSAITPSITTSIIISEVPTTGRPTGQSTPTSPSTSPQETSVISQMAQTQNTRTPRGSGSVSPVTDTFSTVTSLPLSSTPNVHTSPQTMAHTLSPSDTSTTFISNPVSDSHRTQTAMPILSSGTTKGPSTVSSTTLSDVASHSPSTILSTSGGVLTTTSSSVIHENITAAVTPSVGFESDSLTNTTQVPNSSAGKLGTPTPEHPTTVQTVTSATNSTTRPAYMSSTSNHRSVRSTPTLSFPPTTSPLIMTTPDTSSISKYPKSPLPALRPSTDYASSDSPSSGNVSTAQTISTFYTSANNSSFSQSAPGPAVTRSSTTLSTGHFTPLSVASTFSPSTSSSSSTVKTGTSGVPLFPYGSTVGDQQFVRWTLDFTSPLFKPQIGFPLGSSLHDLLYFTDNGQIIFPESEYKIFSYPNPPLGGFTGQDPVALVAPFWDDADFSSRRGTIFYQEYETLYGEYHSLVQQVESWIQKFINTWDYKARWTLKVTWDSAHAYPAQRSFGTNTYQAILSTDGSRSYALFLYQSGGMQWDVTQRPSNSVLMGFSSGDGHYENSPLTLLPAWEKYRPDQFLNSSLGVRGLQVYRLHREERPNPRLRCLQWLKSQPQWPHWGWNQLSCPCSWWQGLQDLRFQPISIGWGLGSRQLCSFSSWRGGVCCSYGPWGELLEGWRVQNPWQFDQELEAQNWCCRWNDKPSFCILYQQWRPRIGCAGYRPLRPAWMFGDPHITTLDGANYTFNGLGDFLLVRAKDGNSSFLLQGRTALTGSAQASNFIAFAAQYNSTSLGPIMVQWLLKPNDTIQARLNNQTVTFETNREDAEGQETFNTTGVVMTRNGSLVSASFDGTVTISVIALSNILHASCSLPEEYQNRTEGLLGVWNNNPDDDFRMPNGSTISRSSSEEMFFHYGMTWRINETSLLGKRDDQLPANFTPVFFSQLLRNNSLSENLASECNGNQQCIYDTLATGSRSTGLHTSMLFRQYQEMNATLNQYPPSIEGDRVVEAHIGKTKLFQYTSSSKNVTFILRDNNTDCKLFENGTLLWTPTKVEPFTLEILARNVKDNLSSVLQPKTVVCACKAESQCLYNQTSRVGNSSLEVAGCKCDKNTFGPYCNLSMDLCEEACFPNVACIRGKGCEACPPHLTGDGRHCAALETPLLCQNKSCPVNYCHNHGHCYISQTQGCQPTCTCPPAFTDSRCFLAGNSFTPTISLELPLRIIQISLSEEENASAAEVNASVAYRLGNLEVRAFFRNSQVEHINPITGRTLQHWKVTSTFRYRPRGPVIDFLNNRLVDAIVEAFLQAPNRRWKRSEGPRNNVVFHPLSREDVRSVMALNVSTLETYFKCDGYEGYRLVYSPHGGVTCVSPCSQGYCEHGGQCQHLPQGPSCKCVSFSIYTSWGERCEHLSMKLGAFFGILFGALGALLLLGVVTFVVLRFWGCSKAQYSYPLDSES